LNSEENGIKINIIIILNLFKDKGDKVQELKDLKIFIIIFNVGFCEIYGLIITSLTNILTFD